MTIPLSTLVVGVATVDGEDHVLAWGIQLARDLGATLHVVHAFALPQPIIARQPLPVPADLTAHAERIQAQLELRVRVRAPGARVLCHAVQGTAPDAIEKVAGEVGADLLIVGATRLGGIGQFLLGATAARVVREADVPVLVVREAPSRAIRRVLLTTDLSERASPIYDAATGVVQQLLRVDPGTATTEFYGREPQVRCLLVTWEALPALGYLADEPPANPDEADLRQFLAQRDSAGLEVAPRVRVGQPVDEILAEAQEWPADLVVLGTHARTGVSRLLLGSVAETTLRKAKSPVLVIPVAAARELLGTAAAVEGRPAQRRAARERESSASSVKLLRSSDL